MIFGAPVDPDVEIVYKIGRDFICTVPEFSFLYNRNEPSCLINVWGKQFISWSEMIYEIKEGNFDSFDCSMFSGIE